MNILGFSDEEVDMLYQRYLEKTKKPQITRESLREWYDGYHTAQENGYIIHVRLCVH